MTDAAIWDDLNDADESMPLSKRELCALTGLTPKLVERFARDGMPTTPGKGSRSPHSYDLKAVVGWLADLHEKPVDPLSLARQRKAQAEAERLEQLNAERAGDFLSRQDRDREAADAVATFRAELLSIPARLTSLSEEDRSLVRGEIVESINTLAKKVIHA